MKKNIMCIISFFLLVSLCACNQEQRNENNLKKQPETDNILENVKIDVQDEYYKLCVEPVELDVDMLTEYLLGKNAVYMEQAQNAEVPEEQDEIRFELIVNDIPYVWTYNSSKSQYGFFYGESPFKGIPDLEEGLEAANDFTELFKMDFSQDVENNMALAEADNAITYTYKQQYKGIDFMGNSHIALGGGETIDGIWLTVEVDTEDIKTVASYNLSQVTEEVGSYNAEEDFLGVDQVIKAADAYGRKTLSSVYDDSSEIEISGGVTEVSVIYIPSEENGDIYWKPGYEVTCEYMENGIATAYKLIMDAFDGYVYDWRGVY